MKTPLQGAALPGFLASPGNRVRRSNRLVGQHDIQLEDLLPAVALDADRDRVVVDRHVLADDLEQLLLQQRRSWATRICRRSLAIAAEPVVLRCLK